MIDPKVVAPKVDSRTILDEQGAEHLTDFLCAQGEPVDDENILKPRDDEAAEDDDDDGDDGETGPMFDAAVQIVPETRRCSTSWVQRKLQLACTARRGLWRSWRPRRSAAS